MYPFIAALLGAIHGLKRKCPKCRKVQVVSKSEKQKSVRCKFCGADIPPGSK